MKTERPFEPPLCSISPFASLLGFSWHFAISLGWNRTWTTESSCGSSFFPALFEHCTSYYLGMSSPWRCLSCSLTCASQGRISLYWSAPFQRCSCKIRPFRGVFCFFGARFCLWIRSDAGLGRFFVLFWPRLSTTCEFAIATSAFRALRFWVSRAPWFRSSESDSRSTSQRRGPCTMQRPPPFWKPFLASPDCAASLLASSEEAVTAQEAD